VPRRAQIIAHRGTRFPRRNEVRDARHVLRESIADAIDGIVPRVDRCVIDGTVPCVDRYVIDGIVPCVDRYVIDGIVPRVDRYAIDSRANPFWIAPAGCLSTSC
jgi:hypothetical protein